MLRPFLFASVLLVGCNVAGGAAPLPAAAPTRAAFSGPKSALPWESFDAALFARAKREQRFVVLDGSAEWCHWCHVMEAVTYHDPEVRQLLGERFLAAKVDVDARPDIEERYAEYGWPATVIFSPDGDEIGAYKGYLAPDELAEILRHVTSGSKAASPEDPTLADAPATKEQLAWMARMIELDLLEWFDDEKGGWGKLQKAPIAADLDYEIALARAGDASAKRRADKTLEAEIALIDPIWGGMYQYSTDGDWAHPHYEKLMTVTAGALGNYADAYALERDGRWRDAALKLRGFIDRFMTSPDGAFFTTEDADLNAHDPSKPFMSGHDYYAKGDAERRALGLPRVDTHAYPRENGLVIGAYSALHRALGDATALASAKRAAEFVLRAHRAPKSALLVHDPERPNDVLHLSDNAAFVLGLVRLFEETEDRAWLERAKTIALAAIAELGDERAGGFFAHTVDPSAVGVFAHRRKPLEDNFTMVRALVRLARHLPEERARYARVVDRTIRGVATPERVKDRGRFLGELELALREARDLY